MPLFVFRRSGSRQSGGSVNRQFSSSSTSDTESGPDSPRGRQTFFAESADRQVESAEDYPDYSSVISEDLILPQAGHSQQTSVEEVIVPSQQLLAESAPKLPAAAPGYILSVEEEIEHYEEESDLTLVSQQESGTLSRSQTKDEITDTDDLLTFNKPPHQGTNIQPNTQQEYVIKTYTCQPISKMDVREALVGTNKKFECQVIGFPPPTIRWFKDNVEITHDPRYHFSHNHEDGVVSMHIEVIKLSDAGLYQCRAENCEGYAITAAHLQVKGW